MHLRRVTKIRAKNHKQKPRCCLPTYGQRVSELFNVGRNDDFFDLGGDSLKGAVVAAQVHAALKVELSLGAIADYPTISALAAYIDTCQRAVATNTPPIVPVARAASMPVSAISRILLVLSSKSGVHIRAKVSHQGAAGCSNLQGMPELSD